MQDRTHGARTGRRPPGLATGQEARQPAAAMPMRPEPFGDRTSLDPLFADGWALDDGDRSLRKTFVFGDFVEAFGFMARVALVAEKLGHHPDWSNSYRRVEVRLTTHDAGGLTALDVALAERMDRLAAG